MSKEKDVPIHKPDWMKAWNEEIEKNKALSGEVSKLKEELRRMELMLQREERPLSLRVRSLERELDRINKVIVSMRTRTPVVMK